MIATIDRCLLTGFSVASRNNEELVLGSISFIIC
jgi:hypothetical protein